MDPTPPLSWPRSACQGLTANATYYRQTRGRTAPVRALAPAATRASR
jgi:hypothetical protein